MDKNEVISNKLNGKNCTWWSFHLKYFDTGKGLAGYLNGTVKEAEDKKNGIKTMLWS